MLRIHRICYNFSMNLWLLSLVLFCNGPFAASVNLRDPSTQVEKVERREQATPKIYTFFQLEKNPNGKMDKMKDHDLLLDNWSVAWSDAGWNPIVLDLDDAKQHPDFNYYNTEFLSRTSEEFQGSYNYLFFMRWLAIAAQKEDAWMAEYDTFPLIIQVEDGLNLPHRGKFIGFERFVPSLMSARASEWERVAKAVLDRGLQKFDEDGPNVFYSDVLALKDAIKESPGKRLIKTKFQAVQYPYYEVTRMKCSKVKKMLVARLGHVYTERSYHGWYQIPRGDGRHKFVAEILKDWKKQFEKRMEHSCRV